MIRIFVSKGNEKEVIKGLVWFEGKDRLKVTIQQSTGNTPWWEDIDVVFEEETVVSGIVDGWSRDLEKPALGE